MEGDHSFKDSLILGGNLARGATPPSGKFTSTFFLVMKYFCFYFDSYYLINCLVHLFNLLFSLISYLNILLMFYFPCILLIFLLD